MTGMRVTTYIETPLHRSTQEIPTLLMFAQIVWPAIH